MAKKGNDYLEDYIQSQEDNCNFDRPWQGEMPLELKYPPKYPKYDAYSRIIGGIWWIVGLAIITWALLSSMHDDKIMIYFIVIIDLGMGIMAVLFIISGFKRLKILRK